MKVISNFSLHTRQTVYAEECSVKCVAFGNDFIFYGTPFGSVTARAINGKETSLSVWQTHTVLVLYFFAIFFLAKPQDVLFLKVKIKKPYKVGVDGIKSFGGNDIITYDQFGSVRKLGVIGNGF